MSVVTLLTDFGTADAYVGEMKGVLVRLAPGVTLVDIAHDIPPGDVQAAAWALGRAWPAYPEGSVHLAVVDPGVGTSRRALVVAAEGHRFVGPDNGIFTPALEREGAQTWSLAIPGTASHTFHGRDVFAPAAARLAAGVLPGDLGTEISDPVRLPKPRLVTQRGKLVGRVVHVDRFGNLITNLPGERLAPGAAVRIGPYDLELKRTFADVASGDPLALIGSDGLLEIAVRDGRADTILGATRGVEVSATALPSKRDSRVKGRDSEMR